MNRNSLLSLRQNGDMTGDVEELEQELQKIYDSEINISIGWFWDGGITLRLGDEMNGFPAAYRAQP